MFLKHTFFSRNIYISLCWVLHKRARGFLCWNSERIKSQMWRHCSHVQQMYPKCTANVSQMSERGKGMGNSSNFWRLLEHWFEALIWAAFEFMWHLSHWWSFAGPAKLSPVEWLVCSFRVGEQQETSVGWWWPWQWFWPKQWPMLLYHLWHIYLCRSSGFCFGCWFGSWILGRIFQNCKIPSEPCNPDLLNNISCFPWVWQAWEEVLCFCLYNGLFLCSVKRPIYSECFARALLKIIPSDIFKAKTVWIVSIDFKILEMHFPLCLCIWDLYPERKNWHKRSFLLLH